MHFDRPDKTRRPLIYTLIALLIAVATIGGIEWLGADMTSAHSGLGGTLGEPASVVPAATPHR